MDKREKLLVARRKLKEFQLNKINHNQNFTSKNQQDDQDPPQMQEITADNRNDEPYCPLQSNDNVNLINEENPSNFHLKNLEINIKGECHESLETNGDVNDDNKVEVGNSISSLEMKSDDLKSIKQIESVFENNIPVESAVVNDINFFNNFSNSHNVENNLESDIHSDSKDIFFKLRLKEQENLIEKLKIEINQSNNKIIELKNETIAKDIEYQNKNKLLEDEINILKEQLETHKQTTQILVAEKAELNSLLSQYQTSTLNSNQQTDTFINKLKSSQLRISELESELSSANLTRDEFEKSFQQLQNNFDSINKKFNQLKISKEEDKLEISEIRESLNIKNAELMNLKKEIDEKKNLLSLAELKIQQLTDLPKEVNVLETEQHSKKLLEQELNQLKESLKVINSEKDEMCKHYEDHVTKLNERYEKLFNEWKIAEEKIEKLNQSEESYIQRLSLMEQQYQREKQKTESLISLKEQLDHIKYLNKSMDDLVLEQENLLSILQEKELEIETMRNELYELRELRDRSLETSKLVSALESKQLGASRAVSQNQELKLQLSEMHDAFVMLSNSKLNLTEQLQDERTVGRKLNSELSRIEAERDNLKEELIKKDNIIHDLMKDKLHIDQITDQMQHYQVQSNQSRTLQEELESALISIETLKKENQLLNEKLNNLNLNNNEFNETNEKITVNDSFQKLQVRFKESMERIAELTDEKQKLEHLVLQLQGETETIGEYITLYQKQRAILHTKAQEKEKTFRQLVEQRNQQLVQLHQLKMLIADLLKIDDSSKSNHTENNSPKNDLPVNVNEEPIKDESKESTTLLKDKTTAKILDILTEIKDCKDTVSLEPNFHPCPWCSGKLITV